jgi:Cu+-exporting ATPase
MVKPTVVSIVALDGHDDGGLLALAAGAAAGLKAPLGAAILESARERDVDVSGAEGVLEAAGAGVVASIAGRRVVVGNAALFTSLGLSLARFGDCPERLRQRGQQIVFVAVDGEAAGFLGLTDPAPSAASCTQV